MSRPTLKYVQYNSGILCIIMRLIIIELKSETIPSVQGRKTQSSFKMSYAHMTTFGVLWYNNIRVVNVPIDLNSNSLNCTWRPHPWNLSSSDPSWSFYFLKYNLCGFVPCRSTFLVAQKHIFIYWALFGVFSRFFYIWYCVKTWCITIYNLWNCYQKCFSISQWQMNQTFPCLNKIRFMMFNMPANY